MADMLDLFNYAPVIEDAAKTNNIRPELLNSLIQVESGGRSTAVSPKGARGFMQVMPATAAQPGFGVAPFDPADPVQNINGGTAYFGALLKHFGGDETKALAAYNAGVGRVDRGGPLPTETQNYVPKVQKGASSLMPAAPMGQSQLNAPPPATPEPDMLDLFNKASAPPPAAAAPQEDGAVSRFAQGVWENLNPMGLVHAITDIPGTIKNLAHAQVDQFSKAKHDYDTGNYSEMVGHGLAGALPLIGPAVAHASETIAGTWTDAQGRPMTQAEGASNYKAPDLARGSGELTGLYLSAKTPEAIEYAATKARALPEGLWNAAAKVPQSVRSANPGVNFARTALDEGIGATDRGMVKSSKIIGAIEDAKNALFDQHGQLLTDFPMEAVQKLREERAKVAMGAAPAEDLASIDNLLNQIENHPNFSQQNYLWRQTQQQRQVPTGAQNNAGQPIMQTQTVNVNQRVPFGRSLVPSTVEDTRGAYVQEAKNTKGKFGIQNVAQAEDTVGRKIVRGVASDALERAVDPVVEAGLTSFDKIKRRFGGGPQTLSEMNARQSPIIAVNKALRKGEARRNNLNPLSLTTMALGEGAGFATGGPLGGAAGAIIGHILSKPEGLNMLARTLNVPVEVAVKIARAAQAGKAGVINAAENNAERR